MSLAARLRAVLGGPRWRKRLALIVTNSANSLLVPLFSPVVSVLVVRLAGVGVWGDFVRALVVAQLAAHLAGWGNKDFVLREFARGPAGLAAAWQTSFLTRLALLGAALGVLAFFGYSPLRWALLSLLTAVLMLAQSFEVLVLYRRDFGFGLGVEALTVTLLAAPVLVLRQALTLDALLLIYIAANAVETLVYFLRYRRAVAARRVAGPQFGWLRRAGPFFLLGLSGLLQSRVDLYAAVTWLPREQVGHYQVYSNLMIYLQSVAAFVLTPFVKSLYRLRARVLAGLALRFGLLGLLITAGGLPAAALLLRFGYRLHFAPGFFAAGALFVLPVYFYSPLIYALFKLDKAFWVVAANGLGVLVNLALLAWWLPPLGALGAAWAAAVTQWALLLFYFTWGRQLSRVSDDLPLSDLPSAG
ncbi:MAG: hypothetical protein IT317_17995 [Anaerolineales bacterium]|nr:hypothetical protein [Anaerolineales bacterium]